MARARVRVVDPERVAKSLKRLALNAQAGLEDMIKRSLQTIAVRARKLAPQATGAYRRSIRVKMASPLTGFVAPFVGTRGRIRRIAHLLEHGTAPRGRHPGTPAQPHLFPAFESVRAVMEPRIREALRQAGKNLW